MNVFKNLGVVNRRNCSSSVVSDDQSMDDNNDNNDNNFCYHQYDENTNTCNEHSFSSSPLSSLYSRRYLPPPPSVITSTKFDNDQTFAIVARDMLYRYEHKNMTEREAIEATLSQLDDQCAFIQAMDLKHNTVLHDEYISSKDNDALSDIIIQTRSIFHRTLKLMWEEITSGIMNHDAVLKSRNESLAEQSDDDRINIHPKTPKNIRLSPIQSSNHTGGMVYCGSSTGNGNNTLKPFKRQRRKFFDEGELEKYSKDNLLFNGDKSKGEKVSMNPFATSNKPFPKFHFNVGFSKSYQNKLFFTAEKELQPMKSLDMPPMSPVRL